VLGIRQKINYEKNRFELELHEADYQIPPSEEISRIKDVSEDNTLKRVFNDMNPNFDYVFGDNIRLLGDYLRSKHKDLPCLLVLLYLGEKIDPSKIGKDHQYLKDSGLTLTISQFMGRSNPLHNILEYKEDKLSLRIPIANREVVPMSENIIRKLSYKKEAECLKERVKKIKNNLESWESKIAELQIAISPEFNSESYRENERMLKEAKQFVHGAVPLWFDD
jgi:hypothetical protein